MHVLRHISAIGAIKPLLFVRRFLNDSFCHTATRSGPKIPAAGYLEGEGFFGFRKTDSDCGCSDELCRNNQVLELHENNHNLVVLKLDFWPFC